MSPELPPVTVSVPKEKQDRHELIIELTPGWVAARNAARRDGYMNASLNREAVDMFSPIDLLLDEIIELDLTGPDRGE